jgi:hypothetical protein
MDADRAAIAEIGTVFFAAFTSGSDLAERIDALRDVLLPQALIIRAGVGAPAIYDVDGFIEPRRALLSGGTLVDFSEWEVAGETEVFADIAQHTCRYAKSGIQEGVPFTAQGVKMFQFVRTLVGWRISSASWADEPSPRSCSGGSPGQTTAAPATTG